MNDDIVTRLGRTKFMQDADVETLCDEAAAEIKRLQTVVDPEFFMLRGRIDILEREIERLRALIAEWHDSRMTVDPDRITDIARRAAADNALAEEARRD